MLNKESILKIVDLLTHNLSSRISEMGIRIELTNAARELLAKKGYDPQYGARPLKRVIQSLVEDKFSQAILDRQVQAGDIALIDEKDGDIIVSRKPKASRKSVKQGNSDSGETK